MRLESQPDPRCVDGFDVFGSPDTLKGELMAIRIKSRGNESAEQLMRRFKKLCEKEGLTKDIRKKEYYEKPSERRNRAKRKAAPRR